MLISFGIKPPAALLRQLATAGAAGLSVDQQAVISAAYVRYFQNHGYSVWCWTVNRPAAMRRLARCGVNGLLSDDPALLQRTLRGK
jgi:glycerophosphoryl diester phosphodiesterase